jgi:hypothetical protein
LSRWYWTCHIGNSTSALTQTKLEKPESRETRLIPRVYGRLPITRSATRVDPYVLCYAEPTIYKVSQRRSDYVGNMSDSETTLDLSSIGRELEIARRSRTATTTSGQSDLTTVPEDDSASDSESASSSSSPLAQIAPLPSTPEDQDHPLPTCLLCFTRPPSAVLLPCTPVRFCRGGY